MVKVYCSGSFGSPKGYANGYASMVTPWFHGLLDAVLNA